MGAIPYMPLRRRVPPGTALLLAAAALTGCAEGTGLTGPENGLASRVAASATTGAPGRSISSITLTPPSPLMSGMIAMVSVRVQLTSGAVWKGTRWEVRNSANVVVASSMPPCYNNADHAQGDADSFGGDLHTENFPLMAGPNGLYTLTVSAYSTDGCMDPADATTGTLAFQVGTVTTVNRPPVLTLPADLSTPWGVAPGALQATAIDPDSPPSPLAFSRVAGPAWVSVAADGTISFAAPAAGDVGTHTVRVRVTEVASQPLSDEKEFHVTVEPRATRLSYSGRSGGQSSDKARLAASLVDDSPGALNGGAVAGQVIAFSIGGASAGTATTLASGSASVDHAVALGAGSHSVVASFAGGSGYAASTSAPQAFVVNQEDAAVTAVAPTSVAAGAYAFTVNATVQELLLDGAEPVPNDGALPGNVGGIATLQATLTGMATGQVYVASCAAGATSGSGYDAVRAFTCTFSGGPFVVDAYNLAVGLPAADPWYAGAAFESVVSVWDLASGLPSGGGTFEVDGDLVSFGFSFSAPKGGTAARNGFVAVRHLADGSVCRLRSQNQMNAPSVNGNIAILTGRGTYSCVDADGSVSVSRANVSITVYLQDNGTPGTGSDRIWLSNGAAVAGNTLQMSGPAATAAAVLTGGNVLIPAGAAGGGTGAVKLYY
jgi:hypothetical protein